MAKRTAVKAQPSAVLRVIEYHPPTSEEIDQYTLTVCRALDAQLGVGYDVPDTRRELAGFLKVIASIYAKQLNKGHGKEFDKNNS